MNNYFRYNELSDVFRETSTGRSEQREVRLDTNLLNFANSEELCGSKEPLLKGKQTLRTR